MSKFLNTSIVALIAAAGTASAQTGPLVLTTNAAQQQIEIEIGPVPGEVRVFGIAGVADGPYLGVTSVSLTTGPAEDFVQVRVFGSDAAPITINTGAGNSDVKVIYEAPFSMIPSASTVTIIGGTGNDKAAFEILTAADSFAANWTVRHGNGDNETTMTVANLDFTSALAIALTQTSGLGNDKLTGTVITNAASVNLSIAGNLGAGNDTYAMTVDELFPANNAITHSLNLGNGFDTGEFAAVLRGGTARLLGTINGGNDQDSLKSLLEGNGVSTLTLAGGAGTDNIDAEYKGRVTGAPRLVAGAGDDFLKLVADQPGVMNPLLDGGTGFDVGIGFGRFVSVEQIN